MRKNLTDYKGISLRCEDLQGRLGFAGVFGRAAPVHIEIGAGKASFLLSQAKAQPEVDFLGIEWASRYYRYAVDRIGRWGLKNVRIIRTDAAMFLSEYVPAESVDCFHLYFPDPWPKKRHHKRRFFSSVNLERLVQVLKPAGQIRVATDHAEYFEQIQRVLAEKDGVLVKVDFVRPAGAEADEIVGTNFERKYLKGNRRIYRIAVRKL